MSEIKDLFDKMSIKPTKEVPEGFTLKNEGQWWILSHVKEDKKESKKEHVEVEQSKECEEEKTTTTSKNNKKVKRMKKEEKDENRDTVFLNPLQEFNRDLSILCITDHGEKIKKVSFNISLL